MWYLANEVDVLYSMDGWIIHTRQWCCYNASRDYRYATSGGSNEKIW